jgi:GNAT superfamily N-acetyltransferase
MIAYSERSGRTQPMARIQEAGPHTPEAEQRALLALCEPLHCQLRPKVPQPYVDYLIAMFAEGAHLAVLSEGGAARALTVWRSYTNTYHGRLLFVDDLVTDEAQRGQGWGGELLAWLEAKARSLGCDTFTLDSGTQREAAHRFYFRAGMTIKSFHFVKPLTERF